jgi:glucosamine kinase
MMDELVVGVDGGGSGTRFLLTDGSGGEIGSSNGEASAISPATVQHSASVIIAGVRALLDAHAGQRQTIAALSVGVAGAARRAPREALAALLSDAAIADDVFVESDATVALEDAFGELPGIVLLAGTGSVCIGRGPTGNTTVCGGWGLLLGDEGGGYWIARRALGAITAALDGREPETALAGAMLTALELQQPEELKDWAATAETAQIAALAATVVRAAENGDLRANALLTLAAEELVTHVRVLARTHFGDERAACDVAPGGGLLHPGSLLRKRVVQRLKTSVPGAHVAETAVNPARGAVRMALRMRGEYVNGSELDREHSRSKVP